VSSPLPSPTTDLAQLCRDLDEWGYCVAKDLLDTETVAAVRARLSTQADGERAQELDHPFPAEADGDHVNQWVYLLHNKGEIFHQLPLHPTARGLATHVLGRDHLLSAMDSHITYPGNRPMPLHTDQWWMPQPVTPGTPHIRQGDLVRGAGPYGEPTRATHPIASSFILNMMWMISDFTVENGCTRVVPGSHLSGAQPHPDLRADEVQPVGTAGSALIWDGRTWHGSGRNTSEEARYGLTTFFSSPVTRALTNMTYGTRPEVLDGLDDEMRRLLGFAPWNGYGATDEPNADFVRAAIDTTAELSP
jgi:ectoine hydroxylase-related dioxygenase (phytanoyl-CoA dioxygenase family)